MEKGPQAETITEIKFIASCNSQLRERREAKRKSEDAKTRTEREKWEMEKSAIEIAIIRYIPLHWSNSHSSGSKVA